MVIDNFNGCARVRNLDIVTQIKIIEEPSLVFKDLWFSFFWLSSEKYKIIS
jgi:hypothetical protein